MRLKYFLLPVSACALTAIAACTTGPGSYPTPVSQQDVDIILEAQSLLSDNSKWTRHEETQCNLDASQWTLFCALYKASYDVAGGFELRRAALEEARYVVDEKTAPESLERRLLDFNNLPSTTFADVQAVLDRALFRVKARLAQQAESQ